MEQIILDYMIEYGLKRLIASDWPLAVAILLVTLWRFRTDSRSKD